jgi:NAD(P)-dependent dehydrogenase (short-subunit alcohol dehydrogenase family)
VTETREPAARARLDRPTRGRLEGAVALVSCASHGVGRAVGFALAEEGASVALCAADPADVEDVVGDITALGGSAAAFLLDSSSAAVEALTATVEDELGPLGVLVNATGAPLTSVPTERLAVADFDEIMAAQLKTPFLILREVGKRMLDRGAGAIVNIASIGGMVALPEYAGYAAAAAGLFSLTRVSAVEWAERGVRVNAVAAGHVAPRLGMPGDGHVDGVGFAASTPMQRLADADEIARAAVFLCSRDASYITGETLVVDGGWTAR